MFKKNEGTVDRWIRAIVGVVILFVAYVLLEGGLQIIGYVVGIISIFTAITGFCALYKVLGFTTLKKEEENK